MTLQQLLDKYCIARARKDVRSQIEAADRIIDEEVPSLLQRLAQFMMDRNERQ